MYGLNVKCLVNHSIDFRDNITAHLDSNRALQQSTQNRDLFTKQSLKTEIYFQNKPLKIENYFLIIQNIFTNSAIIHRDS